MLRIEGRVGMGGSKGHGSACGLPYMAQDGCVDKQDVCEMVLKTEKLKTTNAELPQGSPFAARPRGEP